MEAVGSEPLITIFFKSGNPNQTYNLAIIYFFSKVTSRPQQQNSSLQ